MHRAEAGYSSAGARAEVGARGRWIRLKRLTALRLDPMGSAGALLVGMVVLVAALAPVLAPADPLEQDLSSRLSPPLSPGHPLGTDQLGRDLAARLVYGARLSLVAAVVVAGVSLVVGGAVGLAAGFAGQAAGEALMRVTDAFFAFPPIILAMAIAGALGPSLPNAMLAIAAVTWPAYARLARAEVLRVRSLEFVAAARAVGAGDLRILAVHVLPNVLPPLLVQASHDMGQAILTTAGLSFIGFGAQPPTPEWGVMVSEGRNFISTHWWVSTLPAVAVSLATLGFNLLGDALRDRVGGRPGKLRG